MAAPVAASPETDALAKRVHVHVLKNGMKWLVVQRTEAPVFAAYVRVRAGGADELPGHTGLAHLFEHLAFKGTQTIGTRDWNKEKPLLAQIARVGDALALERRKGDRADPEREKQLQSQLQQLQEQAKPLVEGDALSELYARAGAVNLNATTDKDVTSYFVSLPKNRLELWATVDAQRLAAPVLREFFSERDVVTEERRMRIETDPGGALFEELLATAFVESPYRLPTVGTMPDLAGMSVADAVAFHRIYYVPANMVGCVVGDVDIAKLDALLDRTFGAIPAGAEPPRPPRSEPVQRAPRRVELPFPASAQLSIGFHKPAPPVDDDFVFDVISELLTGGRSARLFKALVTEQRVAASVSTFTAPGSRLDNLFVVSAVPLAPHTAQDVEAAIWGELERLAKVPASAEELEKVRNRVETSFDYTLATNEGLAGALSYDEAVIGNWRYLVDYREHIARITAADIQRVAEKYFVRPNSTTAVLVDSRAPQAPAKPPLPAKVSSPDGGAR